MAERDHTMPLNFASLDCLTRAHPFDGETVFFFSLPMEREFCHELLIEGIRKFINVRA